MPPIDAVRCLETFTCCPACSETHHLSSTRRNIHQDLNPDHGWDFRQSAFSLHCSSKREISQCLPSGVSRMVEHRQTSNAMGQPELRSQAKLQILPRVSKTVRHLVGQPDVGSTSRSSRMTGHPFVSSVKSSLQSSLSARPLQTASSKRSQARTMKAT